MSREKVKVWVRTDGDGDLCVHMKEPKLKRDGSWSTDYIFMCDPIAKRKVSATIKARTGGRLRTRDVAEFELSVVNVWEMSPPNDSVGKRPALPSDTFRVWAFKGDFWGRGPYVSIKEPILQSPGAGWSGVLMRMVSFGAFPSFLNRAVREESGSSMKVGIDLVEMHMTLKAVWEHTHDKR